MRTRVPHGALTCSACATAGLPRDGGTRAQLERVAPLLRTQVETKKGTQKHNASLPAVLHTTLNSAPTPCGTPFLLLIGAAAGVGLEEPRSAPTFCSLPPSPGGRVATGRCQEEVKSMTAAGRGPAVRHRRDGVVHGTRLTKP